MFLYTKALILFAFADDAWTWAPPEQIFCQLHNKVFCAADSFKDLAMERVVDSGCYLFPSFFLLCGGGYMTLINVEIDLPFCFPFLKFVQVLMDLEGTRPLADLVVVQNGVIRE